MMGGFARKGGEDFMSIIKLDFVIRKLEKWNVKMFVAYGHEAKTQDLVGNVIVIPRL